MPNEDVIAMRYARGLAQQAAAAGRMDAVRGDIGLLARLLGRDGGDRAGEFAEFLRSPEIQVEEKIRAAEAVMEKCGADRMVTDFLAVLIRRRRVGLAGAVEAAFADAADAITGDRTAVVRTAMPLTEDQESRLREALSSALGARVWLRQIVDPSLLAGASVIVDGRTFDGTVRGRLDRLGHALAGRFAAGGEENNAQCAILPEAGRKCD